MLYNLVRGVGMDLQFRGQRAHRREGLSGKKLAAQERLLRGKDHLIEDRDALAQAELECHTGNVTHDGGAVKGEPRISNMDERDGQDGRSCAFILFILSIYVKNLLNFGNVMLFGESGGGAKASIWGRQVWVVSPAGLVAYWLRR